MTKWTDIVKGMGKWSSEKISQRIFVVIAAMTAVVFLLFFFVGFDMPYWENPDFNDPLFTDAVMVLMWLLLVVAAVLTVCSVVRAMHMEGTSVQEVNGIKERRIHRYTWLGTLAVMVLTFSLASSSGIKVNGAEYTDAIWLKVSDMFIFTSVILLLVAAAAVVYGATRYIRKDKEK